MVGETMVGDTTIEDRLSVTRRTDHGCFPLTIQIFKGRCSCDLYDLAHAAEWEPYKLHDLQHMFAAVGSVPYRSCTASPKGMLECR